MLPFFFVLLVQHRVTRTHTLRDTLTHTHSDDLYTCTLFKSSSFCYALFICISLLFSLPSPLFFSFYLYLYFYFDFNLCILATWLHLSWIRFEAGQVESRRVASSRLPIVIYLYHYCIKLDVCVCLVCVLHFLLPALEFFACLACCASLCLCVCVSALSCHND